MLPARSAWLLLAIGCVSCGSHEITIEYREIDHAFSWTERRTIQRIADGAVAEARHQLPLLPADLVLRVDADENVSDLTDSTATYAAPARLYWSVDPHRGDGVVGTAGSHLRSMLLHELHHLVRDTALPRTSFMDSVISEGMASAFERDFAGANYPFMDYPNDVSTWVTELLALPDHDSFSPEGVAQRRHWLRQHPDGRRWIGYRAGTYLVDRAMRASGKSAADLVAMPTADLCTASGFLDSGLTVFASTPPRPARGGRVAPGPGFGSRTSPASTARCTSA